MGFSIRDQQVNALANEVKRKLGTKTKEQAIGIALARLLEAAKQESSSTMSPAQGEVLPKST